MANLLSFFNRMPRRGKVVNVLGLLFVLLAIFITVYSVRQRQIYKSRAGSEMFTCDLQRSRCSSLGFIFATLSDCNAALIKAGHIGWKCYDSNDACLAECGGTGVTSTPTPTPTSTTQTCSGCSSNYKYCHYTYQSTTNCTNYQDAVYTKDCSCTTGTQTCPVNTASCLSTPTPTSTTPANGATCTGVSVSKVIRTPSVGTATSYSYLEAGCSSLRPGDTVRVSVTGSGDSPEVSIGGAPWKKTTGCKYNATTNSQTCSLDQTVQSFYGNVGDSSSFTVRGRFRNPADGSWKECSGPTCHVVGPTAPPVVTAGCGVNLFYLDWTNVFIYWTGSLTQPGLLRDVYPGQEIYIAAGGFLEKCNALCTSNSDCGGLSCVKTSAASSRSVCRNPLCPGEVGVGCICSGSKVSVSQLFAKAQFTITQGSKVITTDWITQQSANGSFYYKYTVPADSTPIIITAEVWGVPPDSSLPVRIRNKPRCEIGMVYPKMGGPGVYVDLTATPPATTPTPTGSQTPTPAGGLGGDLNGDGCVNIIDLGILIDNYNPSAPSCIPK